MLAPELPALETTTREYALQLLTEEPQPLSTADRLAVLRSAVDVIEATYPRTLINEHRKSLPPPKADE